MQYMNCCKQHQQTTFINFVILQGEGNKQYVVEEEWSTVNVPMVSRAWADTEGGMGSRPPWKITSGKGIHKNKHKQYRGQKFLS